MKNLIILSVLFSCSSVFAATEACKEHLIVVARGNYQLTHAGANPKSLFFVRESDFDSNRVEVAFTDNDPNYYHLYTFQSIPDGRSCRTYSSGISSAVVAY